MSVQAIAGVARAPFLALPVTLIAVGAAVAAIQGDFSAVRALWALVGLVALHVAVTGSLVGLAVGVGFLPLVGWKLVPVMLLGALSVLAYTEVLARLWIGELFAGLGLGPLPVAGTVLVQTGSMDATAIAASLPAFFMTFNLLLLNEFPDEAADRKGGRRNLVLLLGRRGAAVVYVVAALMVPASLAVSVLLDLLPATSLLACLPVLLLVAPLRWALTRPGGPVPHSALAANVIWNLATNLALAGALLL